MMPPDDPIKFAVEDGIAVLQYGIGVLDKRRHAGVLPPDIDRETTMLLLQILKVAYDQFGIIQSVHEFNEGLIEEDE